MSAVPTSGVIGESHARTYAAGVAGIADGLAVMQGADDNHIIPAVAGSLCLGLLREATINAGDPAAVVTAGEAYAVCGAAVVAGQYLISNAQGQLVPTAAAGDQVIARAISSGAVVGDYIVVLLTPFIR